MSKRKKSYNKLSNDVYYGDQQIGEGNLYKDQYNNNSNIFPNNINDILGSNINLNSIFNMLNNIDFKKLNTIMSLISNGIDINNFDFQNNNKESENIDIDYNEVMINFLNSLKGVLRSEFSNIIDRFIQVYMDDINREK